MNSFRSSSPMLLVEPPTKAALIKIVSGLIDGSLTRDAVLSWQRAVFEEVGWSLDIPEHLGYWYFYSLMYINVEFPDGFFLREQDLSEYLADLNQIPGLPIADTVRHLRGHEIKPEELRWPIAVIRDEADPFTRLPGTRGTFEQRSDLVEHCHLRFEGADYLLLKEFDERAPETMLLGSVRGKDRATELLQALKISNYMLP